VGGPVCTRVHVCVCANCCGLEDSRLPHPQNSRGAWHPCPWRLHPGHMWGEGGAPPADLHGPPPAHKHDPRARVRCAGHSKTIEFAFDMSEDTADAIAGEMMEDLSLSKLEADIIAIKIAQELTRWGYGGVGGMGWGRECVGAVGPLSRREAGRVIAVAALPFTTCSPALTQTWVTLSCSLHPHPTPCVWNCPSRTAPTLAPTYLQRTHMQTHTHTHTHTPTYAQGVCQPGRVAGARPERGADRAAAGSGGGARGRAVAHCVARALLPARARALCAQQHRQHALAGGEPFNLALRRLLWMLAFHSWVSESAGGSPHFPFAIKVFSLLQSVSRRPCTGPQAAHRLPTCLCPAPGISPHPLLSNTPRRPC